MIPLDYSEGKLQIRASPLATSLYKVVIIGMTLLKKGAPPSEGGAKVQDPQDFTPIMLNSSHYCLTGRLTAL